MQIHHFTKFHHFREICCKKTRIHANFSGAIRFRIPSYARRQLLDSIINRPSRQIAMNFDEFILFLAPEIYRNAVQGSLVQLSHTSPEASRAASDGQRNTSPELLKDYFLPGWPTSSGFWRRNAARLILWPSEFFLIDYGESCIKDKLSDEIDL